MHNIKPGAGSAKTGFTLIELLVVIAIVAILVALALVAMRKASGRSADITCMANLRQIGAGILAYSQDVGDRKVPQLTWDKQGEFQIGTLLPYVGGQPNVLICPAAKGGGSAAAHANYVWAVRGVSMLSEYKLNDDNSLASGKPLAQFDSLRRLPAAADWDEQSDRQQSRHNRGIHLVFYDGHVEWKPRTSYLVNGREEGWGWVVKWPEWR